MRKGSTAASTASMATDASGGRFNSYKATEVVHKLPLSQPQLLPQHMMYQTALGNGCGVGSGALLAQSGVLMQLSFVLQNPYMPLGFELLGQQQQPEVLLWLALDSNAPPNGQTYDGNQRYGLMAVNSSSLGSFAFDPFAPMPTNPH